MTGNLQWHPAFYAGIQIELRAESGNLIFENEHQLGTKPKAIDVLIVKKDTGIPVKKNIGRIFRKYNVVEYKSPQDYISVDDFYKVCAYALLFKADTGKTDSIPIGEITVTFVCQRYPEKLFGHLRKVKEYTIEKGENGIYLVYGTVFPIQVIVTKELSKEENLWLYSLTDNMKSKEEADELIHIYEKHQKETLYEAVMDVIVRANYKKFEEVSGVCEALVEIMQPYIEEQVRIRTEERVKLQVEETEKKIAKREEKIAEREGKIVEREGKIVEREGKITEREGKIVEREGKIVEREGKITEREEKVMEREKKIEEREKKVIEGEMEKWMKLTRTLLITGKIEELNRATEDKEYRNFLCKEFALS